MKVLIINTFAEGTSTAKIAVGLYDKLKNDGHECRLLYGAGKKSNNPEFIKIATELDIRLGWLHNQITGVHGKFAPRVMKQVRKISEEFQPDIVQLYNLHYYYLDMYKLFEYLKEKEICTVYGMLDEYPYMGYCCYPYECEQYQIGCAQCEGKRFKKDYPRNIFRNGARKTVNLKKKAYAEFSNLIFTGPEFVINRARKSYLLNDKHLEILDEYVNNEKIFVPRDTRELRKKLGISEEQIVLLNVAPSNDKRKGVADFVEMAYRFKENAKYVFINVGYQGLNSDVPENFIPISFIKDQGELACFYSLADMLVCTSYADTMPNVCLDALSCGTPVLGYNISGIPYVAEAPYGYFLSPGDKVAMYEFIGQIRKKDNDKIEICREYALKRYSPQAYYKRTMEIYRSFETGKKGKC